MHACNVLCATLCNAAAEQHGPNALHDAATDAAAANNGADDAAGDAVRWKTARAGHDVRSEPSDTNPTSTTDGTRTSALGGGRTAGERRTGAKMVVGSEQMLASKGEMGEIKQLALATQMKPFVYWHMTGI